jgi:hypothetical protein
MRLAVVELGQIVEVIWVSLLAGVGITAAYSFVVLGTARSAEARRAKRNVAAIAYGTLAGVCLLLFFGLVILGVRTMLTKEA